MGPPTTVIAPVMINDWPRAESLTVEPNAIATTPAPAIRIPKTSRIKDILAPTKTQNTHGESPQAYGYYDSGANPVRKQSLILTIR